MTGQPDSNRLSADQVPAGVTCGAVAPCNVPAVLATSAERDAWLSRLLAAERAGYDRGLADGIRQGRELEAAELDAAWNTAAAGVLVVADPKGPEARESAARRLRAAEAGCAREAREHWRRRLAYLHARSRDERFTRAAQATQPLSRDYEQIMALLLRAARRAAA